VSQCDRTKRQGVQEESAEEEISAKGWGRNTRTEKIRHKAVE